MPAAKLTSLQEDVLRLVKTTRPHTNPDDLAFLLDRHPNVIAVALDALTRRNLITPIATWNKQKAIYVATAKGKARE